jgi:hypothetical protein
MMRITRSLNWRRGLGGRLFLIPYTSCQHFERKGTSKTYFNHEFSTVSKKTSVRKVLTKIFQPLSKANHKLQCKLHDVNVKEKV